LGSSGKERPSEAAFDMFKTAACQHGLILAVRALWAGQPDQSFNKISAYIDACVIAINAGLNAGRKEFMIKDPEIMNKRFNMLDKLDASKSVHFRYFWIQLLETQEAIFILRERGFASSVSELVLNGRHLYRKELINNVAKARQRIDPSKSKAEHEKAATDQVDKELQKALLKWFNITSEKYKEWLLASATLNSSTPTLGSDDNLQDEYEGSSLEVIAEDELTEKDVDSLISENKYIKKEEDL
jgi:hypothetical protein